jgi:hypothetical protein
MLERWKREGGRSYSDLTLTTEVESIGRMTDHVKWECRCGRQKRIKLLNVVNGSVRSCGCLMKEVIRKARKNQREFEKKSADEWMKEIPEIVNRGLPSSWSQGTSAMITFLCKCGREYSRKFSRFSREKGTCGECDLRTFRTGETIGGIVYVGEERTVHERTTRLGTFLCRCGKEFETQFRKAVLRLKTSCGTCKVIKEEEMGGRKFGKLRMKVPKDVFPVSEIMEDWVCDCGNEKSVQISSVVKGRTSSCGKCREKVVLWYETNREAIRSLRCPVPAGKLLGGINVLEEMKNVGHKVRVECMLCGKEHSTNFHEIRSGGSLTCGCASVHTSAPAVAIAEELRKEGVEALLEHQAGPWRYDVFIPSANLLVEFNGLKWHSMSGAKERDVRKYEEAIRAGFSYIAVFEDEWRTKRESVMTLIRNRVGLTRPRRSIRPAKCEVREVRAGEANAFHTANHYIGPCRSKVSYGAFLDGRLVACASFSHPTRQSSHPWELLRMASVPDVRVHGIWSKVLTVFIREHSPTSIVSFSDNRLFSGGVYEKIGFEYDGEVAPDYYWTRSKKRYHKSGLRKKGAERTSGLTERELREAQGYRKIWDLGKKRWVWRQNHV